MDTSAGPDGPRTSLYTDHYELTMLQAALHSGAAHRKSVFEAFARRLPDGRRYGIVARHRPAAGGDRGLPLRRRRTRLPAPDQVVNEETLEYLADFWFSGDIWGYPEGEAYFPQLPRPDRRIHLRRGLHPGDLRPLGAQP